MNELQEAYKRDIHSDAIVTISREHESIHAGIHYICKDNDNNVNIVSPKYYRIKTPNTITRTHFIFKVNSSFPGTVELFENPTITGEGTGLTVFNNDRNSANTSESICFKDTTVSSDGTRLDVEVMGSDPNGAGVGVASTSGGIKDRNGELILKQDEDYLVKFTPEIDNSRVSISFDFYEV